MPMPHSPAPDILDFDRFMAAVDLSQTEICRALYHANPQTIRIKKERVAVRNLARVIDATLRLANRRGFAAMSMRALCREAGLSMGGLYAMIQNKDDLVGLIQSHGFMLTRQILGDFTHGITEPLARLDAAVTSHLFLTEAMRPWFYFSYMEARHLPAAHRADAVAIERETEDLFHDIIIDGIHAGQFAPVDARLTASMTKAMLQDWYLKRGKYRAQNTSVSRYGAHLRALLRAHLGVEIPDQATDR